MSDTPPASHHQAGADSEITGVPGDRAPVAKADLGGQRWFDRGQAMIQVRGKSTLSVDRFGGSPPTRDRSSEGTAVVAAVAHVCLEAAPPDPITERAE